MTDPGRSVHELVVIVPSRGRPDAAAELAGVCTATMSAHTWLLFAVDDNDPTLAAYDTALAGFPHAVVHAVPDPAGHVRAINAGATEALRWKERPYALAKLDDDHRPRTRHWDAMLLADLDQLGTGIVYANDLLQGPNKATAVAMTADIAETLGYMGPPDLTHLFVDDAWVEWGRQAGCLRYRSEVVIEHMHPVAGKSEWTEGHQRVNAPAMWERDTAAWNAYQRDGLAKDVAKIKELRS